MKISVVSYKKEIIEKELKKYNLQIDNKKPNIVIAFGGDGTFLFSEQKYPCVPKIFIRHKTGCTNCQQHDFSEILTKLLGKQYTVCEELKIQAIVNKKKLVALNDINIHYKPPRALRFQIFIDKKQLNKNFIADGAVIATPFGSTGYFRSITRKSFSKGIGVAVNNPTVYTKPMFLKKDVQVQVKIIREKGVVATDCNTKTINIKQGDNIFVSRCAENAKILILKGMPKIIEKY